MKRNQQISESSGFLWQTAIVLYISIYLFTQIAGFIIYLVACFYLRLSPFASWKYMETGQHLLIICSMIIIPLFSIFLTAILTVVYRRRVYAPLKLVILELERASGYEGLAEHVEPYLRGGAVSISALSDPRQMWAERFKQYIDKINSERYYDDTTGCLNKKYYSQAITDILKTQMMCSISPEKSPGDNRNNRYGIYLVDIDHFKLINDDFGHAYGDQVLAQVGLTLRSVIGSSGIVIRHGGEEFLIVVCLVYPMIYSELAEKMRVEFGETVFATNPATQEIRPITCSIGFLPFPVFGENRTALSVEQHVNLSDQAMYMAKTSGRNTWRGIEASITPSELIEFEKASNSLEYGISAGYFQLLKPCER